MTITENTIIVAAKEQVSGDLNQDEVVILNLKDGVYYGLNAVGWRVWKLIQEPMTVGEVKETLLQEYEVEESCCRAELMELVDGLLQHGLAETWDEPIR